MWTFFCQYGLFSHCTSTCYNSSFVIVLFLEWMFVHPSCSPRSTVTSSVYSRLRPCLFDLGWFNSWENLFEMRLPSRWRSIDIRLDQSEVSRENQKIQISIFVWTQAILNQKEVVIVTLCLLRWNRKNLTRRYAWHQWIKG